MTAAPPPAKQPTTVLAGPYGHPLHPALVAIPIGAWVCSVILDVGSRFLDTGATASRAAWWLLGIGVLGALAVATFGFLDLFGIPRWIPGSDCRSYSHDVQSGRHRAVRGGLVRPQD